MRTEYHAALESTKSGVLRLGTLADDALRCSIVALERGDEALAQRVITGGREIEALRRKLEAACMELIWRQQPVAGELRQVAGMLQISTDLERLDSYAVEIARAAQKRAAVSAGPAPAPLGDLARIAQSMVSDALRAYRDDRIELADLVIGRDDELDAAYQRAIKALEDQMRADSAVISSGAMLLLVVANIERAGDRAQNIAWKTRDIYGA
jgi:phosphate transport system protein